MNLFNRVFRRQKHDSTSNENSLVQEKGINEKGTDSKHIKVFESLNRPTQNLFSNAEDLMKKENYASALLLYVQILRSEPKSVDGIAMFTVATDKLLESSLKEYTKFKTIRDSALSRLRSGSGTETDARELANALITMKQWDMTTGEYRKIGGGQFGAGSGGPAQVREQDIKAGVFLADAYLSIVRGEEKQSGSGPGLSKESQAILEKGMAQMKRAVERLCLAIIPNQRLQQLEFLAHDFAGDKFGKVALQIAKNPEMFTDPIELLPTLAEEMAKNYAFMCNAKYQSQ